MPLHHAPRARRPAPAMDDDPMTDRTPHLPRTLTAAVAGLLTLLVLTLPARAQTPPFETAHSRHGYAETIEHLEAAVQQSPLNIVTRASATLGARAIGVTIPGNMVLGLFAPQYAVRMLEASVDAGYEAPLRLYVVERPDGAVEVRYRRPSEVFRPYGRPALDAMAQELDAIFAEIAGAVR